MADEDARGFLRPVAQAATLAYLAASGVFLWSAGYGLGETIHTYHPYFTWSLRDMTADRIASLIDAQLPALAIAYSQMSFFSMMLIVAMAVIGVVAPFIGRSRVIADPVVLMVMTVASVFLFAAYSNGPVFADMLWQARALPVNLANLPIFWILTMMFGAILVSWTVALLIHDIIASMVFSRRNDVIIPAQRRR